MDIQYIMVCFNYLFEVTVPKIKRWVKQAGRLKKGLTFTQAVLTAFFFTNPNGFIAVLIEILGKFSIPLLMSVAIAAYKHRSGTRVVKTSEEAVKEYNKKIYKTIMEKSILFALTSQLIQNEAWYFYLVLYLIGQVASVIYKSTFKAYVIETTLKRTDKVFDTLYQVLTALSMSVQLIWKKAMWKLIKMSHLFGGMVARLKGEYTSYTRQIQEAKIRFHSGLFFFSNPTVLFSID